MARVVGALDRLEGCVSYMYANPHADANTTSTTGSMTTDQLPVATSCSSRSLLSGSRGGGGGSGGDEVAPRQQDYYRRERVRVYWNSGGGGGDTPGTAAVTEGQEAISSNYRLLPSTYCV